MVAAVLPCCEGFLLAVLLAEKIGLFYVEAVGITGLGKDWDIVIASSSPRWQSEEAPSPSMTGSN